MDKDIRYQFVKPEQSLADFVESFWFLENVSDSNKAVVILPDGRMDLFFSHSGTENFHVTLLGIETQPAEPIITAKWKTFAISFKPLAIEFLFKNSVSNLLNNVQIMPTNFWDFSLEDLNDFDGFCKKATQKLNLLLPTAVDPRKRKLFELVDLYNGEMSVQELSEKALWSSRQINRYFNKQFGLSLKQYCNILRFRASFNHLKEGKLFPQHNFSDQSHFIKAVKKLSGFSPKELSKNKNDRFIQFSLLLSE